MLPPAGHPPSDFLIADRALHRGVLIVGGISLGRVSVVGIGLLGGIVRRLIDFGGVAGSAGL